jgi:hypothetical protein
MKRYASWLILVAVLFTASVMAAAKGNDQPKYKVVEVKHLTVADGIDLPAEYLNGAYDSLREELAKTGIFETVIEDGGTIPDADAASAVVLECKITKFPKLKAGSVWASAPYVVAEVTLSNHSDHKLISQFTIPDHFIQVTGDWSKRAKVTGWGLAYWIKHNLKK